MRLISLDCIIFDLQRFGGISNYWRKIIEYNMNSGDLIELIYSNVTDGELMKWGKGRGKKELLPLIISRYLSARISRDFDDVFHTSYYRLPSRKVRNKVVTVYDFTYEKFMNGIRRDVHSFQKMKAIKNSDTIICISDSTRNDLREYAPDIKDDRLHVIPLAVDFEFFHPPLIKNKELSDVVLFVGGRSKYKRFDLAIDALSLVSNFRLGIIGPKLTIDEKNYLNSKLEGRWLEFGLMKSEDMHIAYGSAFAFMFPSDYEGFGLPILESMACGCPVICSNSSSLPEVGGGAALYANTQDFSEYAQIIVSLESDSLRKKYIELGFQNVKKYSWEETCKVTQSLYYK